MNKASPLLAACRTCVALFVLGCSAPSTTVPVEGVVTFEGKPVSMANVTLVPLDASVKPAMAVTDNEGIFRPNSVGEGMGVVPGQYKVLVVSNAPGSPKLPSIYAEPDKTPLVVTFPVEGRLELNLNKTGK